MKRLFFLALIGLSLSVSQTEAGGHGGCACCGQACAPCAPVSLKAVVTEHKYTEVVHVIPAYTAEVKEVVKDVPVTRCVPVCVKDPCTGCTRTEMKTETVVEKVKTWYIEVHPPKECPHCKEEVRTGYCTKVFIEHPPAPCCK